MREDERGDAEAVEAAERALLGEAWPRSLIAEGSASTLTDWWLASRRVARAAGLPDLPRHPLRPKIQQALFEARRARHLTRGLEGAEQRLAAEAAGLEAASGASGPVVRISRLLVVSADGSERFYRQVERLREQFANRLQVLLLECDESELGAAAFGEGRRARALLLHHKDAVVRLLGRLDPCEAVPSRAPGPL